MPYHDERRWLVVRQAMRNIQTGKVTDADSLLAEMRTYNSGLGDDALCTLAAAFGESDSSEDDFWKITLKCMAGHVLATEETFGTSSIPVLQSGDTASVAFTARQCVTIVCIGFFCAWPFRSHLGRQTGLAPMNFTDLLGPPKFPSKSGSQIAKLRCFVNYTRNRLDSYQDPYVNSSLTDEFFGDIVVTRRGISSDLDAIVRLRGHAIINDDDVVFHPDGNMHSDDAGTVEVDFANAYPGGGVIGARGAVQEEIRIAQCPDLLCMRLVCPRLGPDDAVFVHGFDVTNDTTGYASTFAYASSRLHGSPDSNVHRTLIAIDAKDYSSGRTEDQYSEAWIRREIKKAYVGFERGEQLPRNQSAPAIVTGNWGAGAFGGDPLLKVAIQVVAAALAGRKLVYYTNESSGSSSVGLAEQAKVLLAAFNGMSASDALALVLAYPPKFSKSVIPTESEQ